MKICCTQKITILEAKKMLIVFFYFQRIVYEECVPLRSIINAEFYNNIFVKNMHTLCGKVHSCSYCITPLKHISWQLLLNFSVKKIVYYSPTPRIH